jgi:hypothetical protein
MFASTTSSLGFTSYITMHTGHEILQICDPAIVLTASVTQRNALSSSTSDSNNSANKMQQFHKFIT